MRKLIILPLVKPRTRWSLNLSFHGNLTIYLLSLLPPPTLLAVVILLKFQVNTLRSCIMIPYRLQTKIHTGHTQSLWLIPCLSPNLCIIRTYQMNCMILQFPSLFTLLWLVTSTALARISCLSYLKPTWISRMTQAFFPLEESPLFSTHVAIACPFSAPL